MSRVASACWAAAVLALSTVPLAAGYAAWWALPVLVGAVVVPTALVGVGRMLRIGPVWIATGAVLLAVVAGVSLADQGVDTTADPWRSGAGLLAPLVDGIPRLLTAPRPAPAQIGYLVPAALLTWIAAVGVSLATTAKGRARIAPLIGAVVLQTAGGLLTAGAGDRYGMIAAASVILLLIGWVSVPARPSAVRARTGRRAVGTWGASATAAVIVGALALPGAALAGADRFEPRTLVDAPRLPAAATNPLPDVALWNSRADDVLFQVTSASPIDRLRLAVLPDFDGASWTLEGTLRPVGVIATPTLPPGEWRTPITYRLTPGTLHGAWIPSIGRADRVDADDVLMDLDTGVLVTDGDAMPKITVTATANTPSDDAVERAGVPPETDAARDLRLPRLPERLAATASAITADATGRWEQITDLSDYVRGDRVLNEKAPSGASYGRIAEFLFDEPDAGGQEGTTEQFAASFAVLARAVGIPTRLVVGFDPDGPTTDGTTAVTGADARVWAQVYLARAGWVDVDPSPDSSIDVPRTPPDAQPDRGAATPAPATPSPAPSASTPSTAAAPPSDASDFWGSPAAPLGLGAVLVLAGLVALLALSAARARRRAAWRARGAAGAWAEVMDAAALAGHRPVTSAAPEQVARALATSADSASDADTTSDAGVASDAGTLSNAGIAAGLAGLVARAQRQTFSPEREVTAGDDWAIARQVGRALRRDASWWRRVLWPFSTTVFRRR